MVLSPAEDPGNVLALHVHHIMARLIGHLGTRGHNLGQSLTPLQNKNMRTDTLLKISSKQSKLIRELFSYLMDYKSMELLEILNNSPYKKISPDWAGWLTVLCWLI